MRERGEREGERVREREEQSGGDRVRVEEQREREGETERAACRRRDGEKQLHVWMVVLCMVLSGLKFATVRH